jgi:hypothetical protein
LFKQRTVFQEDILGSKTQLDAISPSALVEASGQLHTEGKILCHSLDRRLGRSQSRSGRDGEDKISTSITSDFIVSRKWTEGARSPSISLNSFMENWKDVQDKFTTTLKCSVKEKNHKMFKAFYANINSRLEEARNLRYRYNPDKVKKKKKN